MAAILSWYQCVNTPEPYHADVIKWKNFPRYWPFVRRIHRSPVNSPHKGQWRGALMFSLICVWINGWVNSGEAGDLRRHRPHYDVIVMRTSKFPPIQRLGGMFFTLICRYNVTLVCSEKCFQSRSYRQLHIRAWQLLRPDSPGQQEFAWGQKDFQPQVARLRIKDTPY